MRFDKLLCVALFCLSGAVWAVDTDQDALPDDWEIANGRDPLRPDFQIEANSYTWDVNVTRTDRCKLVEGVLTCNWFVGGGIPGTIPFSSGVSPANVYGVDLSGTANVQLYRGNSINAYTNAWNIYIYPPSVADVSAAFSVRTLPMSHSALRNFTLPQLGLYCGGGPATETVSCVTQDDHRLSCTKITPYVYKPGVGQCAYGNDIRTDVYSTKGTIAHVAGIGVTTICAMTEYGSECFGGSDVFALVHDLDGDGLSSSADNCPLLVNVDQANGDGDQYGDICDVMPTDPDNDGVDSAADNCPTANNVNQLDTDSDGQGDACDTDDDNDGGPDTSDRFPLNRAAAHDGDNDGVPTQWNPGCDSVCQANSGLTLDNCPTLSNPTQANFDGDANGNACDSDDDNDGVPDSSDAFDFDPTESVDTDNDTIGNNADWDDDNDGVPDAVDAAPLNAANATEITLPLDANYKGLQLKGAQDAIR